MKNLRTLFVLIIVFAVGFQSYAADGLTNLKVNYQTEPLGTDATSILFSWAMASNDNTQGTFQNAYQIIVLDEAGAEVWNSQKVDSGVSLAIPYKGSSLKPTHRYDWMVKVWDESGNELEASSWFETGLMNSDPNLSAWDGATWIGGDEDDMVLQSHYLSVFNVDYQVQFRKKSTKAAFIFGANDERLMNKDLNLNGMQVGQDESYISVELDITGVKNGGNAKVNIYRVGYDKYNTADAPFKSFDIPKSVINEDNQYSAHQVHMKVVFGLAEIFINGMGDENNLTKEESEGFGNRGVNLNPFGAGNNYISFPMLADIGFHVPMGQRATFSNVEVRNFRPPSNLLFSENLAESYEGIFKSKLQEKRFAIQANGYYFDGRKGAIKTIANPSKNAAPMLRTVFPIENKTVKKARVYATARGIYELYLNGKRVSEDYFNPGLTQYNKNHLYQTYDVTDLLESGAENAFGAWMSEGWWSGNITFRGENWNFFGDRQSLLAKMVITYEDGTEKVITTNTKDWKLFTEGPVRYGSFFQGEVYDATKEAAIANWSTSGYDDSSWHNTVSVPLKGTGVMGAFKDFRGNPKSLDYSNQKILGQIGENASIVKTLVAKEMDEVRPKVFVYDMGQNMVGVPKISIKNGKKGQTIRMRFAEVRYPDLAESEGNVDMIMIENIRAALTQDVYVLKGGDEIIQPRFTFHGYRFIEITGIDEALPLTAVEGKVLSSVKNLASNFESSNDLVNKLWENITWSLRGNFLSIPTDTPARNERMGWNGDINVFSRAATWLTDSNLFLKRHLMAMRDMQADSGRFSDVAPVGNGFGGTLWGSAGIVVPWETYQQYGDISLLEEHYDAMKKYIDFLRTKQNENAILNEGPLGDWLSPENSKNDNTMLWVAYQAYDLDIMHKVATLLGKDEDATTFKSEYEARKAFFNTIYLDENGKSVHSGTVTRGFGPPPKNPPVKGDLLDTQASYAIPLAFNLFTAENHAKAVTHLTNAITRKNIDDLGAERPEFSLMTGFIGTASIGEALSENEKNDIAYQLLQTETYPSWLYPVKNGATTIWERLNSYTIENGFGGNNTINSFNHYAFGAIAAWMYNYSLGIQRHTDHPGFKEFYLKPTPDPTGKMTYAKGHYDSMYGRIVSEWKVIDNGVQYNVTVPTNTKATLTLTAEELDKIKSDLTFKETSTGGNLYDVILSSGSYEITVLN